MFGYDDLSINYLTGSPITVWLMLLVLTALAVFTYYRTNPPLPRYLKIILGSLRLLAILTLILALLEPVISFSRSYERPRRISFLIDRSDSMEKQENGKSRRARVDSLLSLSLFEKLQTEASLEKYYFADIISTDAADISRDKTAIGDILYDIERMELTEAVDYRFILTDGSSNFGREPTAAAENLSGPLFTIDMAAGGSESDIAITKIEFNPVLFVGQITSVKVSMSWQGELSQKVIVRLSDSSKVLKEASFRASQENGLAEISLQYIPVSPGHKILKVSIPRLKGERNSQNNSRSFAVKVLKSKMSVLLVSSRPDYEVGFLKRFFESSDRYEIKLLQTGKRAPGQKLNFPTKQTEINRYDLIILHDPDPRRLQQSQQVIVSYLSDRGGSLWLLLGEQFAARGPVSWFNQLMPFYQSSKSNLQYREFHAEPVEGNLLHPANRLADDQTSIRLAWSEIPPFKSLVVMDELDPDGIILAETADPAQPEKRLPVTGYKRHGPGRVFVSAALPYWSWEFDSYSFESGEKFFEKFLEGTASWLTVKEDLEPVRISPVRKVFSRGEAVRFEGFAFDLGFRPLPGVSGNIELSGQQGQETVLTDLIPYKEGEFRAEIFNLSSGNYRWTGRFEKDGRIIQEESGEILVESFTLEEFDLSGNITEMTAIAARTGGKYYRFDKFDEAIAALDLRPVAVSETGEITLWGKLWLLLLFLSALSLEWLLRKIFQLI
ncbi:MAG: hypothetical protein V3S17_00970 [candidate division Zixibacteria bacterium]